MKELYCIAFFHKTKTEQSFKTINYINSNIYSSQKIDINKVFLKKGCLLTDKIFLKKILRYF